MLKVTRLVAFLATFLACTHAGAAVSLVKDINQGGGPGGAGASSFVVVNGLTLFLGIDAATGQELWSTDGTSAGTHLVRDILPGSSSPGITQLTLVGNVVYFFANDGVNGVELWRSDGTLSGTHIVADIMKGSGSSIPYSSSSAPIASLGSILYFGADDGSGLGLWRSDGTAAGTYRVSTVKMGNPAILVTGGKLFFEGPGSNGQGGEVWTSDGTAAGTKQLSNAFPGETHSSVAQLTATSAGIFFQAQDGKGNTKLAFTKPDGSSIHVVSDLSPVAPTSGILFMTAIGADVIFEVPGVGVYHADTNTASSISSNVYVTNGFQVLGSRALFTVGPQSTSLELWTTDGTASGTHRLGASNGLLSFSQFGSGQFVVGQDGFLYFVGSEQSVPSAEYSIWRTDGTDALTSIYTSPPGNPLLLPAYVAQYKGEIFFDYSCDTSSYSGSYCLWASDGTTTGTAKFFDPAPDATVEGMTVVGSSMFYTVELGTKLFVTDGTSPGTRQLTTFVTQSVGADSQASGFTPINGQVGFIANDGVHGNELWLTSNTGANTQLVTDLNPGSGDGMDTALVSLGSNAIFGGSNGTSEQLWVTDGTASGTKVLANVTPQLDPWNVVVLNGIAYFAASDATHGFQPFRSDGTVAGTYKITDTPEPAINGDFRIVNGKVTFYSQTLMQYWVTDGTAQGTVPITATGSASITAAISNGMLYYIGITNGADTGDLWVTDGTVAGTHLAVTVPNEAITNLFGLNNRVLLQTMSTDPSLNHRAALFSTDGTAGGTSQVSLDSVNTSVVIGDRLVYSTTNADGSNEIRSTDGTVAGSLDLMKVDSVGAQMGAYKNTALLSSAHFVPGSAAIASIWRTDGTTQGTHLVESGVAGNWFQGIGNTVFFQGSTQATGEEPYLMDELSPNTSPDQASTTADTAVTVDVLANDGSLNSTLTPSSLMISVSPQNGSTSIDPSTGKITYTPAKGFSGVDTFAYIVADALGQNSAPTIVSIVVGAEAGPSPGTAPGGSTGGTTGGSTPPASKSGGGAISLIELLALFSLAVLIRSTVRSHQRRQRHRAG